MTFLKMTSEIAAATKLKKSDVRKVITLVFSMIAAAICRGESFRMYHFGLFKTSCRKGMYWTHPATKEKKWVDDAYTIKFKPTKSLRYAVRGAFMRNEQSN